MKTEPVSMKKMRGVIDPLTLGFLIIIVGAGILHKVYDKDIAAGKQARSAMVTLADAKDFDSSQDNDSVEDDEDC